jgi:hypothetical protein
MIETKFDLSNSLDNLGPIQVTLDVGKISVSVIFLQWEHFRL